MVNVKVVHKGAVRRFTLPTSASWIELEAKLRSLFNIPKLSPFTLSYADEDNDIITLSTDVELRDILSSVKTIKFILKFSTPDDTSDSEDSSTEVWVLEGGNAKKPVSVTDIEADIPDNVPQKNVVSTTNQEPQEPQRPQFIETDSHDIIESSSNKRIPVGDNLEKIGERKPVNVLDDDFFKTLNRLNTNKRQTSIDKQESSEDEESSESEQESSEGERELSEGEQELIKDRHESIKYRREQIKYRQESIRDEEESTKDDESTEGEQESVGDEREMVEALTLEQDQPRPLRRDLVVNLKQFKTMIELNEDAIKESPQLVASIKDIMDQIRRLDSFRPTLFNRPTPIQQTPEPTRSETPQLPIPGKYPEPKPATPVLWATKATEDREGHQQYHNRYDDNNQYRPPHHNVNNYDNNRNNRDNREQRETKEEQDTTDLRVIYGEQLKKLREMGIKDEDALVGLLVEHKGDVTLVADSYYENYEKQEN